MNQSKQGNQIVTKPKAYKEMIPSEKLNFKREMNPLLEIMNNLSGIMQVHTLANWKQFRDFHKRGYMLFDWADWADEELENYDRKTLLIGKKEGVSCYMVSFDAGEYK